jgi:hypothetical protein
MVQGKIFGPQRRTERTSGRWKMLHNDGLHKFVLPQTDIIIIRLKESIAFPSSQKAGEILFCSFCCMVVVRRLVL